MYGERKFGRIQSWVTVSTRCEENNRVGPNTNWELNLKDNLVCAGSPNRFFYEQQGILRAYSF